MFVLLHPISQKGNAHGKMPEWSIGAVSKTVDQLAWSQGSNPCLSAERDTASQPTCGVSFWRWGNSITMPSAAMVELGKWAWACVSSTSGSL